MAGPTVDGTSSHGGQEVATAERPDQTPTGPSKSTSHQDLLRNLAIRQGHVVVADVEIDGDSHFERQKVGTTPADLRRLAD